MAAARKFLVISSASRSKKVAVEEPWTLALINSLVEQKFELSMPALQYFDTDVDEWIEMDNDCFEDIQTYKVLKVRCNDDTANLTPSKAAPTPETPSSPVVLKARVAEDDTANLTPSKTAPTPETPCSPVVLKARVAMDDTANLTPSKAPPTLTPCSTVVLKAVDNVV